MGKEPKSIEPLVPVDLVVDHSIMIDYFGTKDALDLNMKLEFKRNLERYQFMKWGMQAFDTFGVVPPGFGIVHQVNLEYLARGVHKGVAPAEGAAPVYYPDSLVGTDSHTTMINGIGVVGWGVGGIEAEAAMLGQPVYFLTPDVVGFEFSGRLREGVTATDLVLAVTEILRREKVVGKFVEFFGVGTESLSVPDRATMANMAPEYGATMGFFPVDDKTIEYFQGTGRTASEIEFFEAYFKAQGLYGVPRAGQIDYSKIVRLDLGTVAPSLAGPKRPQDRIEIGSVKDQFTALFSKPPAENGFNQPAGHLLTRHHVRPSDARVDERAADPAAANVPRTPATPPGAPRFLDEMNANKPTLAAAVHEAPPEHPELGDRTIGNGDVLIAAITSCTNTSNPSVMIGAGLLAKKAVEAGLTVEPHIKTSLAPGSRIVTEYLTQRRPPALPREARLRPRRLRLHHLHRQCRRPDAGDQRRDHQERPGLRRGALGQPQLRGAHPSEPEGELSRQPAARRRLRDRRHRAARPDDRAGRQGHRRQGRLARRHLADQRRDRRADEVRDERQGLQGQLRQGRERAGAAVGKDPRRHRPGLQLAGLDLHRRAAVLRGLRDAAAAPAGGDPGRACDGPLRRLDHHRPHLARRGDQGIVAGRQAG